MDLHLITKESDQRSFQMSCLYFFLKHCGDSGHPLRCRPVKKKTHPAFNLNKIDGQVFKFDLASFLLFHGFIFLSINRFITFVMYSQRDYSRSGRFIRLLLSINSLRAVIFFSCFSGVFQPKYQRSCTKCAHLIKDL